MQDSLPAGGLRLYREGVEPSGSLRKVSGYIALLLSRISPDARIVYLKKPFGVPARILAYLGRYTHRVAIANSRIQVCDDDHVAFTWKAYRDGGAVKSMRLKPDEFIRRFLLHVLPDGFHRIRHFGFLANGHRTEKLARCRSLLTNGGQPTAHGQEEPPTSGPDETISLDPPPCPECGGVMRAIADLPRGGQWPSRERH